MKTSARALLEQRYKMESEFHELMTSRKISRRDLLKFAGWSAAVFGVAGPAMLMRPYKAEAGKVARPMKAPSPAGDIVLTYADIAGPENDYRKVFATDYLAENPDIKDIVFDTVPYNDGLEKQLLTVSGQTGAYDIMWTDEPWIPALADVDFILPVQETFEVPDGFDWDDFHPGTMDAAMWKGALYGVPNQANTLGMAYRMDLYDEIGMEYPVAGYTWADFEAACQAIQDLGQKDLYGFTSWHQRGDLNTADYMCLHHSWVPYPENQFWNPDTWEPQMNSEAGVEALEYYIHLMDEYMAPGALDVEWTAMITAMQQGSAGQMVNWTASFAPLENEEASKVVGLAGHVTPPAGEKGQTASHRGVWTITIPSDGNNIETAWDFAVYQSTKEGFKKYAMMGGFAPLVSLFEDPEINEKYPYTSVQKNNYDAIAIAHAGRPHIPEYSELMEVCNRNLSRALAKELTAKEGMDAMAKECGDLLSDLGYWEG